MKAMETALVEILLNGNVSNTTTRRVSAAEVAILRNIHGGDAVAGGNEAAKSARSNAEEVERLRRIYGKLAVEKVYPGSMPNLPKSFAEVGLDVAGERPARRAKAD